MSQLEWDGQHLGGDCLALTSLTTATGNVNEPSLMLAANSGDVRCIIRTERLGEFLRVHCSLTIACHDAGPFFWAIHDHLHRTSDRAALEILWDWPRSGRLHDITLLDQLIREAEHPSRPRAESLRDLARRHLDVELVDDRLLQEQLVAPLVRPPQHAGLSLHDEVVRRADAVLGIFRVLIEAADRIIKKLGIDSGTVERFGPLSLAVQVRGTIAATAARRNTLLVDVQAGEDVIRDCDAICTTSARVLWDDVEARNCFKRDGDQPRYSVTGFPQFKNHTLEAWLESLARELVCLHAIPFTPPSTSDGRISTDPLEWAFWARCHPLLQAWADLMTASNLRHCFERLDPPTLRPEYQMVPYLRTFRPDLDQLRRLSRRAVFRPSPGHIFLVVSLRDLELRALAAVCEHRYGQSRIADLLRQGDDPCYYAAHRLLYLGPRGFESLKISAPDRYVAAVKLAKMLLHAVPLGIEPGFLRSIAKREFEVDPEPVERPRWGDFSEDTSARIYDRTKAITVEKAYKRMLLIFPELSQYLSDDAFAALAERLGISEEECVDSFGRDESCADTTEAALRKLFLGVEPRRRTTPKPTLRKTLKRETSPVERTRPEAGSKYSTREYSAWCRAVWRQLHKLASDRRWKPSIEREAGDPALYAELLGRDVATPVGRVRGRLPYAEARAWAHLSLAEDATKAAAFAVVAAGFRLVGISGAEFVIEVPTVSDIEARGAEVECLAGQAAEAVLGTIPIPCRGDVRDRW